MIGKRRFIVILVAVGACVALEVVSQALGRGGLSTNAQVALIGVVGLYMGSKFAEKPQLGGK